MNSRSAYTLAITTPLNAMIAIASLALKTPSRIRNSPTKFDEPGIASVASATIRNSDREHRRAERDAAHVADVLRAARAPREQRDDEQQRRHDEAVVDHLQQRALRALRVQREDPERDEAELRDRGVPGDQARVGLA